MAPPKGEFAFDFSGKTALITGGARGIGFGIASLFADAGARTIINDVDLASAQLAASRLVGSCEAIAGDISNERIAKGIIDRVEAVSPIDFLINNAGITEPLLAIAQQRVDEWQRVMDVNLRGTYLMCRAVSESLCKRRSGAIVNIASIAGICGFPASHAYGVSKAGVAMMTKTLAGELARHSVRVNAVAPGMIEAPMLNHVAKSDHHRKSLIARVPLGKLGTPADVGQAVAFLCSDAATYITGVVLPVDGGWLAYGAPGAAFKD